MRNETFTSNTRLYLDDSGQVVTDAAQGRQLLASEHSEIPMWLAEQHSLVGGTYDANAKMAAAQPAKADTPASKPAAGRVMPATAKATKVRAPKARATKVAAKPAAAKPMAVKK